MRRAAACAGETAVILVEETTVKLVAATVPKTTLVAPVRWDPVMVTFVPPVVGPDVREILVTEGATVEGECVQLPAIRASASSPPTVPGTPLFTTPLTSVLPVATAVPAAAAGSHRMTFRRTMRLPTP